MAEQEYVVLDYETRSEIDLKQVGAYEYSVHPTTEILCASWRVGTKKTLRDAPIKSWSPFVDQFENLGELLKHLTDYSLIRVAHNAFFETVVTHNVLYKNKVAKNFLDPNFMAPMGWLCTAAMAASHALPRNLEGACLALDLPVKKDMDGRRLILKMCKPRRATKGSDAKWHQDPVDIDRLIKYCETDVRAETELFLSLPELCPKEKEVWALDQTINMRGFFTDKTLIDSALEMIETETHNLNQETGDLTSGLLLSTSQRDSLLAWLRAEGVELPNLQAKTVRDSLGEGIIQDDAKRLLEIRQAVSRTSTAKYEAFKARSQSDGRVRDILVYHTASTGRWGGSGVQPQNFPRGIIKDTVAAAEIVKRGDLELVRCLFGDPMSVFSSCLRSVIIAPPGKEFFCADYAAIETRVLFWVAGHEKGLDAYRNSRDLYREIAVKIYDHKKVEEVTKEEREVGKRAILGCGYGMGKKKFAETCKQFGQEVSPELAEIAVDTYRTEHAPVKYLWYNLEKAAVSAVQNPGKAFKIGGTTWFVKGKFLYCELPSKRRLAYYGPEIRFTKTPWDEKKATLFHWGVNGYTRKWEIGPTYGGKLTENVVQAVARDLMAEAMLRIERGGYEIVLSVHDELLAERKKGRGTLQEFCDLMRECPPWAEGLPVNVEGWTGDRYRK